MKKFLTLIVAAILSVTCIFGLSACGGNEEGKTLYVYTEAGFAPYEYLTSDNEVVGVDIDIMKEVGAILGYKVVVKDISFDLILNEVQSNKYAVGAAGMTKTAERDAVALASTPYATSVQYAIVPKNTFTTDDLEGGKLPLEKLNGKVIGTQEGTTGYYMIDDGINGVEDEATGEIDEASKILGNSSVFAYSNAIVASSDIGTKLGAVVIDKLPAESIVKSNSNLECFELNAEPESYVLYFNKEATELVKDVNKILAYLIDSGVVNYFTVKHSGGIV